MAGYTRQSTFTDGDIINAADSNDEFDQLVNVFSNSTGHKHDGTAAEGPVIGLIGDPGVATPINKVVVDDTNNQIEFNIDVSGTSTEQFVVKDGVIEPTTDNDIDLGSTSKEFKNLYLDGTATVDGLAMPTTTVTDILDEDTMSSDSATALATQQSIKAYVDSQVTAQDLDFQGDSGGALSIDLDSETLDIAGGTGIDTSGAGNTLTVAIDSTVATLTGTQTLTNKTLTTPVISTISNTGTVTLPTSTDTLVGRATTDTLTNKTLTSPVISTISNTGTLTLPTSTDTLVGRATTDTLTNKTLTSAVLNGTISGTSIKDEDTMTSDSASHLATQQSIKAYVDSQVAAVPTGDITSVVAGDGLTGGATTGDATLNVVGGTGITANANDIEVDTSVVATLTGTQTLTNKSIDASQLTGTIANARLDQQLQDVAGLAVTDGNIIVGDGTNFVAESGATARTSLGVSIGTDVQAYDAGLASIAGLTTAADKVIYTTASDTYAVTDFTSFGRSLVDDADATAARTTLGLGTAATQDVGTSANNVVQLDGSGRLPAVDGSQLTNITETDPTALAFAIALG